MKLTKFDVTNCRSVRTGAATIRFSRKGCCGISKVAMKLTQFKTGDTIAVFQDEENPADWYLAKAKNGFELRDNKNISSGLLFNSAAMAKAILDCFSYEGDTYAFKIGSEPVKHGGMELWPIITAELLAENDGTE